MKVCSRHIHSHTRCIKGKMEYKTNVNLEILNLKKKINENIKPNIAKETNNAYLLM